MIGRSHKPKVSAGFSLLEVVLALAILTGAIAVLGEVVRTGVRNAQIARDQTQAQLLCESKLAEITAGIIPAESVQGAMFETNPVDDGEIPWLYSIELGAIDQEGLVAVRVTVAQDLRPELRPVEFSLTRWMVDPGVVFEEESFTESATTGDGDE